MLFGDIKGFSRISDRELPIFVNIVLGTLAEVLDSFGDKLLFRNTWGDGVFCVFKDPAVAANCAIAMQNAIAKLNPSELGLPDQFGLRLAGNYGPVYPAHDPILKTQNFFGAHVSRAARLEPVTPVGGIYVTEPFAAILALEPSKEFACDYVGTHPAAKGYGNLPMYLLRKHAGK